MKRLVSFIVLIVLVAISAIGLVACGAQGEKGETGAQGAKGEKGDKGDTGAAGVGIASVLKTSSDGLFDTYTITYTDESTNTFVVSNGENGVGIQTATINQNNELVITLTDNTSLNLGNVKGEKGDKGDIGEKGEKGEKGDKGDTGAQGEKGDKGDAFVSVSSVAKTASDGLQDTYTIIFSDGETVDFTITNGEKGDKGETGATGKGIKTVMVNANNELVITLTDNTVLNLGNVKGAKGDKGDTGEKGDTGISVVSIEKTATSGLEDTYTITFSDDTTTTFTITNGEKGDKGEKGDTGTGVKTAVINSNNQLVITLTDNAVINLGNVKGAKGDKGDKGDKGATGAKGDTGVGISNIQIDYTGHVKIYCTNGDTYTVAITEPTHEHNFDTSITFPTCASQG